MIDTTPAAQRVPTIPYRPFPLTEAIHAHPARFRVIDCGRQFGKSTFGIIEGFLMSHRAALTGQDRPRGLITSPTYRLLETNWRIATQLLAEVITDRHEAEMRLELGGSGDIDFKSTDSQGGIARGSTYTWVLMDEAARSPESAWEEDIRPSLTVRQGRAIFISTPCGRNWFYRLWHLGQEHPEFHAWRYSTWEGWQSRCAADPALMERLRAEWEMVKSTTSERTFQQEYLAEFLEDEGQLWTVSHCLRGQLRGALPGRRYVAGLDVAHVEDWMVTAVVEEDTRQLVGLYRSRHHSWDLQKAQATAFLRQYPQVRVLIDSTGVGDPIAQDLRNDGLDVEDITFTARRKQELVENLSVAIDHGYLGIPEEGATAWLLEELRAYQEFKTPSGHIQYATPAGVHDDGVTAVMLACWGLRFSWTMPVKTLASSQVTIEGITIPDWMRFTHRAEAWRKAYPQRPVPQHPYSLTWETATNWRRYAR